MSGYKDPWIEIMEWMKRIEGKIDALAEKVDAGGKRRIPATEKQVQLLLKLSRERGLELIEPEIRQMTVDEASRKISVLLGRKE